ncbi:calcium-activated chloride channel regulator 1-like [Macrobrachium rosenbergii]|uniref:calcium-activated chloride channel regulator 1-like n=1 Tax=Macrobrachium rosenbergii TaxID=79674 RepID=UPI0034D5873C
MPWTLQVGGCGKPGRTIYITHEYFSDRNLSDSLGDPGRVLVQEWAKYRWGVFEEYGHPGDPLYPAFHRTPTQSHTPTGCSNVPVQGSTVHCESHRESSCRFSASASGNDEVTSSLMYLHHLPHVTQFCDGSSHASTSPTKQNALCSRRSVWEVIEQHPDFANGSNPAGDPTRDVTPTFMYVRPAPTRYVMVVEDTTVMNLQKRWEFLRKAVRKLLVYDVPVGSAVGVVLFDHVAKVKLPLTPTPASLDERQRLATSSLPRNPSRIPESQKCIICGLEEAVKMLEKYGDSAAGGVILLVTAGSSQPIVPHDLRQLEAVIKRKGVRVVPVLYPVTGRNPQPVSGIENLAQISGTESFAVLDEGIGMDGKVSMMVALMDALYGALRIFIPDPNALPLVVHKKEFPGGIGSISQGTFTIDESLGGQVRFALTYYDLGHVGNMINLIDPKGRGLETLNLQEEDGDVNMIFVTVQDAMAGEWLYRVENRADSHQSLFVRVLATPRPANTTSSASSHRDSHAVTISAWTSTTSTVFNVSNVDDPVLVYAQVTCGGAPVVGAKVEASLQRLGFNSTGSHYEPHTFLLFDNGNGDADTTKNDGVYSRYLPSFGTSDARYTLSFTLTDNDATAQVIMPSQQAPSPRPGIYVSNHHSYSSQMGSSSIQYTRTRTYAPAWPRCCGSVVPYTTGRPTGQLSRTLTVGVIDIVGGKHSSIFSIPPSRIGDFRAEINPSAQHITFYWTAPGSNRDHGTVANYEVVFSREAPSTAQGTGEMTSEWAKPFFVGTASSHTVLWRRHDGVYYFAIRGVNHEHEPGPWSNIVEVFMPHPPTTTEINTRGSTQGGPVGGTVGELGVTTPQPSILTPRDIMAIVGAACAILVVILMMTVYYLIVITRRRRQQQEKKAIEVLEPATTTPAGCETDSETNSITKPPPPPPEALAVGEAEVTGKRSLSPIQSWPASTLLAEHERRRPNDSPDGGDGGGGGELSLHHPDLGVPYMPNVHPVHPHPFYYHTPNGHYIEDNLAMDTGSMVSTQPSESLLVYKVDTSASDSIRPPSSSVTPTPVSWEGGPRQGPTKVPPPTPPKPTLAAHLTLGGVAASPMGTERKRRNVTQV